MTDDPTSMAEHPDELLATYVDGTATPEDRAEVEAHLFTCLTCRAEVEIAATARRALATLPELESPGIVADVLAAAHPKAVTSLADPRPARSARWRRGMVGAGLAAAAVVAAVFVLKGLGSTGATTSASGPGRAPEAAAGPPALIRNGTDYSAASLDALARSIASSVGKHTAAFAGAESDKSAVPVPTPGHGARFDHNPADVQAAFECLQRGTGLATDGTRLQLQEATFQGTPAYIGVFLIPRQPGGEDRILLLTVSRDGCQPLHVVSQTI